MKLNNIVEIKATLVLKTGLHIGSGDSEMHIGGIDNAVIKNPITQKPYIPGSSLKGKIRSLLEWRSGEVKEKPLSISDIKGSNAEMVKDILRLFGVSADSNKEESVLKEIGVARLGFQDCEFTSDWEQYLEENNLSATEAKFENTIDRITSTAGNPRQTERIPAGAKFDFKLTLRQFENDSENLIDLLLKGLRLLELDSLGGSGSRGYGKVEFQNLTVGDKAVNLKEINPFA
ncbi:type III-A CRISPR-associated RAMP protein Csm3 [Gallibacterium anatis]|nr:type III-A CRISPR-associated RAMP protein Csm3 [Gallibacterium anatis]KGQ50774.1 CRISPR-associated protein [Gallibacterium anatis 10672-6]KGQ34081.1 CRISPR-associated protein [Gallibacterium anatis]KGQ51818.1 CRISPR-associated protein [Gallibacterium anatis]OBW96502.1 CRISPR-associated protein [Gallibacterium anatis]OBW98550.1 CRISPR-associated protein [Gallibacterium anatis]